MRPVLRLADLLESARKRRRTLQERRTPPTHTHLHTQEIIASIFAWEIVAGFRRTCSLTMLQRLVVERLR
jgi:hypothetical protein